MEHSKIESINSKLDSYDITIIGGGINGVGIAAEASRLGYKVLLIEKGDFASGTSSASSKLIHGGLRYLEHRQFKLVSDSIKCRDILLKIAPFLVQQQRFIIAKNKYSRPNWLVKLGLFIYDHFGNNIMPSSKTIDSKLCPELKTDADRLLSYYDAKEDDARLVIINALDAKKHGATLLNYSEFDAATPVYNQWKIQFKQNGVNKFVNSKSLINATGVYAKSIHDKISKDHCKYHLSLVRGTHIVLPKFYDHDNAFLVPLENSRVIFVIPYQQDYVLVGTTESVIKNPEQAKVVSNDEVQYLLNAVNENFKVEFVQSDIVWKFAGARVLVSNSGSDKVGQASREHKIVLGEGQAPPLLSIFGGKITSYQKLSQEALKVLMPKLSIPSKKEDYGYILLPGTRGPNDSIYLIKTTISARYPWLPEHIVDRVSSNYGGIFIDILKDVVNQHDLGKHFGHGLYEIEVNYLIDNEWATCAEDILWRRTKLGLLFSSEEVHNLDKWIKQQRI